MTRPATLSVQLLSDTTFSSGESTPGVADIEVAHTDDGLPFIGGKALHGLLRESWLALRHAFSDLEEAAKTLLGYEADLEETAILRIGDAHLDAATAAWARYATRRDRHPIHPLDILGALTDLRHQTAKSRETGAPVEATLRSSRVILRGTRFEAQLDFFGGPSDDELRCLALCALASRHGGLARNRGRGFIRCLLDGDRDKTLNWSGLSEQRKPRW